MEQPLTAQQQKKLAEQHLEAGGSVNSLQRQLRLPVRTLVWLAGFSLVLGFLCAWRGFAQGLIFGGAALVGYSLGRIGVWLVGRLAQYRK